MAQNVGVPKSPPKSAAQTNADRAAAILMTGVPRLQQIYSTAVNPTNVNILNIPPTNVGLCRGFLVKVSGTIVNTNTGASGVALTRTGFGVSNALSAIAFTDTNNQNRHQTTGRHMMMVNSSRQPMVFAGAYAPNVPINFGNNWNVETAPSSITTGTGTAAVQTYYYVPLSFGQADLRGAVWLGITNAVAQLQLTINPTPVVASGDAGAAMYSGNTGGWTGNVTVTVWQDYIDQIPMVNGEPLLPDQDIATLYQIQTSSLTGIVVNTDFALPFANWRAYQSTMLIYNNAGVYNVGSDVNYFALQTANSSNIWKYGPSEAALFARTTFMADPPPGCYWFSHRNRPIRTDQFGNTQITMNPSAVTTGANVELGYEYLTQASQVMQAQSLPTN